MESMILIPSVNLGLAYNSHHVKASIINENHGHSFMYNIGSKQLLRCHNKRSQGKHYVIARRAPEAELHKDSQIATVPDEQDEKSNRIATLVKEIKDMIRDMNDGETSPSAYDTAWVARIQCVDDPTKPHFPMTLDWVLNNQLEDGSWGDPNFYFLYDRLVCTLSCVLTLTIWNIGHEHIKRGMHYLRTHIEDLNKQHVLHMTIGFEITFPAMLKEARTLGLDLPYDLPCIKDIINMRDKKVSLIPIEAVHSVHTSMLYTLEALQEAVQWDKILNLKSKDGSYLGSPASTAVVYMKTGDKKCLEYLTGIVNKFGDTAPMNYPMDLFERTWAVDIIQRLGIEHHFREEITIMLDYVFRNINKQGASWSTDNPLNDVDDTSMAFRLLRLHGYPISPDVLEYFKDDNGNFFCFPGESSHSVTAMYNLYRFSQIAFPGETVMREARTYSGNLLKNAINTNQVYDKWSLRNSLENEVVRAVKYPWRMHFSRLEVREYIDDYSPNDVWIGKTLYWMYGVNNTRYLELAKLDYSKLQAMYKEESNLVLEWWNDCGLKGPYATNVSPKEIHFSIAATLDDPEYSASRMAYSKCNCIENVVKDLFANHESVDDLRVFVLATKEWNPKNINSLPTTLKLIFTAMYTTFNELANQASNAQRKDVLPYLHDQRTKQIQEYIRQRESTTKNSKSLMEYIDEGKRELGLVIRLLPAMFLMGERLKDPVLKLLDDRSRIHDHLSSFLRIFIDIKNYKSSKSLDAENAVSLCMRETKCGEEEAVSHLQSVMENSFDVLVHETLKPSRVPRSCRRLMLEHARITQFFFHDDFNDSKTKSKKISEIIDRFYNQI